MTTNFVAYEHPLHERIRTFMRVEYVWRQLEESLQLESDNNCIRAISSLLQLLEINERSDLKSEAIKSLDKLIVKFHKIHQQPDVDGIKVQEIIRKLDKSLVSLSSIVGKLGSSLNSNEWLSTIKQKMYVPGGYSPVDLPFLAYWLRLPIEVRINQLSVWQQEFYPLATAINNIMYFIRMTNATSNVQTVNGNYQKILETQFEPQLITVGVPSHYNVYPEISGNKHRISIRFLQTNLLHKAVLFDNKVDFNLSICW